MKLENDEYGKVSFNIISKSRNKTFDLVAFLVLFLLLALRHESMGVDLGYYKNTGYLQSFESLSGMSWDKILRLKEYFNYERGYIVLNKIIGTISAEKQFFIASMALITLIPYYLVFSWKSKDCFLSYIIIMGTSIFLMLFSGIRQSIAVGLCFLLLGLIQSRKPIPFVIGVLLASLFHKTATIFLLAYPVYHLRISRTGRLLSILLYVPVFVFKNNLVWALSSLYKENVTIVETGAWLLAALYIGIYIVLLVFSCKSEETAGYANLFYLATIIQILGGSYGPAGRMALYFLPVLALVIPAMVEEELNYRNKQIIFIAFASFFIFFGITGMINGSYAKTNPYVFFWNSPQNYSI